MNCRMPPLQDSIPLPHQIHPELQASGTHSPEWSQEMGPDGWALGETLSQSELQLPLSFLTPVKGSKQTYRQGI